MKKRIKEIWEKVSITLRSKQGKNTLTFGVFLILATIFWFFMTLNDEVKRDYTIPITITDLPEDITMLSESKHILNVSVTDRGRNLIKHDWGRGPRIDLKFSDFKIEDESQMILSEHDIKTLVRAQFGNSSQIDYIKPDSIVLKYTSRPGEKLPVYADIDVQASPQHIVHGDIIIEPDSVTLYAPKGIPSNIISVHTNSISSRGITDTTTYYLSLNTVGNTRAIPNKVKVTVPVEPLIAKTQNIAIKAINVPRGYNLAPFPASIAVNFLIPMSCYNSDEFKPIATIDYNDIREGRNTIKVRLSKVPDFYRSIKISPKEVEFVVERPLK